MTYNFWQNLKNLLYIYQLTYYNNKQFLKWVFTHKNWYVKNKKKEIVWTARLKKQVWFAITMQIIVSLFLIYSLAYFLAPDAMNKSEDLSLRLLPAVFAERVSTIYPSFVISHSSLLFTISLIVWLIGYSTIPWIILGGYLIQPLIWYKKFKLVNRAKKILDERKDLVRIGIAGSYGKTSMKEFLVHILSSKFDVAYTKGNLNTIWGNAQMVIDSFPESFATQPETSNQQTSNHTLPQILISEMGEYKIGEIAEIARLVNPTIGILTGINEAHLERYKKIENTIKACFEIVASIPSFGLAFINGENKYTKIYNLDEKYKSQIIFYYEDTCQNISIKNPEVFIDHTEFELIVRPTILQQGDGEPEDNNDRLRKEKHYKCMTQVLGKHNLSAILLCVYIALSLEMKIEEIVEALETLKPVEYRIQPYQYNNCWIINNAYNGNIDGFKAGINFLSDVGARLPSPYDKGRTIIITPGIVEGGKRMEEMNREIAKLYVELAKIEPVRQIQILLSNNSESDIIADELQKQNFTSIKRISDHKDLQAFLDNETLSGDVILMQNDITENYG
jgi:UDP-N-acetylmuramoyl-tripeptide--D-alanyl-D-alanine ligase